MAASTVVVPRSDMSDLGLIRVMVITLLKGLKRDFDCLGKRRGAVFEAPLMIVGAFLQSVDEL
jgi:hypothetical protein